MDREASVKTYHTQNHSVSDIYKDMNMRQNFKENVEQHRTFFTADTSSFVPTLIVSPLGTTAGSSTTSSAFLFTEKDLENLVTLFNVNENFFDLELALLTKMKDINVVQTKEPSVLSKMKMPKLFVWEAGLEQLNITLKWRALNS